MKTLTVILSSCLGMSAMAATSNSTISLVKTSNNGTVAQQYQVSTTCRIQGGSVVTTASGHLALSRPAMRQAAYTNDIPNEAVLDSLAMDAAHGIEQRYPGSAGGGTTTYLAMAGTAQILLQQDSGNLITLNNTAGAAVKLKEFLDLNCK